MKALKRSLVGAALMGATSSLALVPALAADEETLTCIQTLTAYGLPPNLVAEYCNKQALEAEPVEPTPQESAPLPAQQSQPSAAPAEIVVFSCVEFEGLPTTMVRTARGDLPLIAWKSEYFNNSGYSPQTRCQIVSDRFQGHARQGNLRYISHGIFNQQKVLCVAERNISVEGIDDYYCQQPLSESLLLTLEAEDDPEKVLGKLFDVATQAGPDILLRSNAPKPHFGIDLDELLGELEPIAP